MSLKQLTERYKALAYLGKLPPEWHPSKHCPFVAKKDWNGFVDSYNNKWIGLYFGLYVTGTRYYPELEQEYFTTPWEAMAYIDYNLERMRKTRNE